jgi:hypothetical protein
LNDSQHAIDVAQDIIVPESQDAIAPSVEILGSHRIGVGLGGVLSAIELDDEAEMVTGKVGEVGSDRCLPAKVRSRWRNTAQVPPQFSLRRHHVAAQFARALHAPIRFARSAIRCHVRPPTPDPSPPLRGGRAPQRSAVTVQKLRDPR